jgi:DNA-binding transcriptional ArsR family regulator
MVPHNTMSAHLAALARTNLVSMRRDGRMIFYGAAIEHFRSLIEFLLRDCCNGRAEICAPLIAELSCCAPRRRKREKAIAR